MPASDDKYIAIGVCMYMKLSYTAFVCVWEREQKREGNRHYNRKSNGKYITEITEAEL